MKFDLYEYIGVIVPGAVILLACSILYPSLLPMLTSSITLGDLGLVLIFAFVAGHLVQAGGNLWELIIWYFAGGVPTSWAINGSKALLSKEQIIRLEEKLMNDFKLGSSDVILESGIIREIYVRVRKLGKSDRVEKFNRNYGLMRGVAVALIASGLLAVINDFDYWPEALLLFFLASVATYRMVRFGKHYARELYAEYLAIDNSIKPKNPLKT